MQASSLQIALASLPVYRDEHSPFARSMLKFRYDHDFLVDEYTRGPFVIENRWPMALLLTLIFASATAFSGYLALYAKSCCAWPLFGFLVVFCFFAVTDPGPIAYRAYPTRRFSAEDIRDLGSVRRLRYLGFHREELTEEHARAIASLNRLREVDLWKAHTTDATMEHLAKLPRLERLVLDHTQVTDDCIPDLLAMPRLRSLNIVNTGISDGGILELRSRKPQLKIEEYDSCLLDIDEAMS